MCSGSGWRIWWQVGFKRIAFGQVTKRRNLVGIAVLDRTLAVRQIITDKGLAAMPLGLRRFGFRAP